MCRFHMQSDTLRHMCRSPSVGLVPDMRKSDLALFVISRWTIRVLVSRYILARLRALRPAIRVDSSAVVLAND